MAPIPTAKAVTPTHRAMIASLIVVDNAKELCLICAMKKIISPTNKFATPAGNKSNTSETKLKKAIKQPARTNIPPILIPIIENTSPIDDRREGADERFVAGAGAS